MSQAGELDVVANHPQIPTMFVENVGIAIPAANTLDVLGTGSVLTTGAGNTITISVSGVAETFTVDASTPPGTNPVVPTAGNDITVHGTFVNSDGIPVQTNSVAANAYQVEVQLASQQAASSNTHAGLASFNSNQFTVDANGYVSEINGLSVAKFTVDAHTAPGTNPVVPTAAGIVTVHGTSVAAAGIPVQTDSLAANSYQVEVQLASQQAASSVTHAGLSSFDSTKFTVDANGFVGINGTGVGETITGNSGGALSPTLGNWNILGSSAAAGTSPVTTAGAGSTLTVEVQTAQAIAATDATKIGLAAFNSADFTVDANGFVTFTGSGAILTVDGDTGSATPSGGVITIYADNAANSAGATVLFKNSASTSTLELSDAANLNTNIGNLSGNLTNVSQGNASLGTASLKSLTSGAGANTAVGVASLENLVTGAENLALGQGAGLNYVGAETNNILLANAGVAAESNIIRVGVQGSQTATYVAGISGATPTSADTPQVVLCDNTGNLATISSSASGFVLTSNGAATPTFQAHAASSISITGDTGGALTGNAFTFTGGTTGLVFNGAGTTETLGGTLVVANGGTASTSFNTTGVVISGATATTALSAITLADGQLAIGSNVGNPSAATLTAGTGISITNGHNSISIAVNGAVVGETITGNSGGALSPTAGNWNILGASTAAGTTPVSTAGAGSTLTVNVQKAQAIAATDATKVGLANFNSAEFSVDANGFVSTAGSVATTYTGDSGAGPAVPSSGNLNIFGLSGAKTSTAGSTVTIKAPPFSDASSSATSVLNTGEFVTGAYTRTLPASAGLADGDLFIYVCTTASALVIQAVGAQQIRIGSGISSAAGTATSNAIGASLTLRFRAADGFFYAVSSIGTWTLA